MLHVEKYSPRILEHIFYYDPPTNISFGGGGLIPDPYETKYLKLQKSLVPNSGNGVIARKNIPEETVAAHFSLHMYNHQEEKIYYANCKNNKKRSDDERRACVKYDLFLSRYRVLISLPPELDKEPLPTLGPKVNHHFQFNNSIFTEIEHPRWGIIQSVRTTKNVKAGQEIFTHYEYERYKLYDFPHDFPWYHLAHKNYLEAQTKQEHCDAASCDRNKLIRNEN